MIDGGKDVEHGTRPKEVFQRSSQDGGGGGENPATDQPPNNDARWPAKKRRVTAMTALLLDPKLLNYILLALYAANASHWALHGSWPDSLYWTGALIITVAVTWGYARQ